MRKNIALLSLFISSGVFAQTQPSCSEVSEDFSVFYKMEVTPTTPLTEEGRTLILEKINKSIELCPKLPLEDYQNSEILLKRIVEPMNFGEERNLWTNNLLAFYDQFSKNHPGYKDANDLKKIIAAYNSRLNDDATTLTLLEKLYTTNPSKLDSEALVIYTNLLLAQNPANSKLPMAFIKKIDLLNGRIIDHKEKIELEIAEEPTKNTTTYKSQITSLELTSKNIEAAIKYSNLTCEQWNEIYKSEFEANKKNSLWHQNALHRLELMRCSAKNNFFIEVAKNYYAISKTAKSAYYLAEISQQNGDRDTAAKYYLESAELDNNPQQKAKTLYKAANLLRVKNKVSSVTSLENAIALTPDFFDAYVLLAQIYASADTDCTKTPFERKALNILAAQTVLEINNHTRKFSEAATQLSKNFLLKAPNEQEIKAEKMKGKKITFGCWINKTITIE